MLMNKEESLLEMPDQTTQILSLTQFLHQTPQSRLKTQAWD